MADKTLQYLAKWKSKVIRQESNLILELTQAFQQRSNDLESQCKQIVLKMRQNYVLIKSGITMMENEVKSGNVINLSSKSNRLNLRNYSNSMGVDTLNIDQPTFSSTDDNDSTNNLNDNDASNENTNNSLMVADGPIFSLKDNINSNNNLNEDNDIEECIINQTTISNHDPLACDEEGVFNERVITDDPFSYNDEPRKKKRRIEHIVRNTINNSTSTRLPRQNPTLYPTNSSSQRKVSQVL